MKCEPRPKYTPRYVHFPMAEHNNTCTYHKDVPNDNALSKGLFKSKETNFSARTEFYFDDKELERDESYQKVYNERLQASATYVEKRKRARSFLIDSAKSIFSKVNRKDKNIEKDQVRF